MNAINAADGDFSTYATLTTVLTTANTPVGLRLGLTATAPAGYRAGVVLATATSSQLASAGVLGTVTLRTYLAGTGAPVLRETKVVPSALVLNLLGASQLPTQLEFTSSLSFNAIQVEFNSVVNVNYSTNIYYAYAVPAGIQVNSSGYLSRFSAPTGSEVTTRTTNGLLCLNTDVLDAGNVADFSLANFAQLRSTAAVGCNPILRAKLANVPVTGTPNGYYAGFVVGQGSILDVSLLNNIKLTTYRNGVAVESKSGAGALLYKLLAGNKAQVAFAATSPFDEVEIERTGPLTVLNDLEVYYAFGFAPGSFLGLNARRSDFSSPVAPNYSASAPQVVSVPLLGNVTLTRVDNPQNAADDNMSNFASLRTFVAAGILDIGACFIKLELNGSGTPAPTATRTAARASAVPGLAGNRVGMVVGSSSGLLDVNALQAMTLATYDESGNVIESFPGTQLLNLALLDGTSRNAISFLASRDFTAVGLLISNVANVNSITQVYYAFAQDVPLTSPQYPLPVELTSFEAKWTGSATELHWATASEKNSSYFVVERSINGGVAFRGVGQVAAAGSSTSPLAYKLRDAAAATLGVATLYYRLRQVDNDGTQAFSPVVVVTVGKALATPQLQTYPNPAPDAQAVQVRFVNMPTGSGLVQTYSEMGQLVNQQPVGEATTGLVLPRLAPGLYHVIWRDAAGQRLAAQGLVVSGR